MKIFPASTLKYLDAYTIEHEPISSVDLMERAAMAVTKAVLRRYSDDSVCFAVFAGCGNNGGDAFAVARMLLKKGYAVDVWSVNPEERMSPDCYENFQRLIRMGVVVNEIRKDFVEPSFSNGTIIIDGLFGSGLNRPLAGVCSDVVRWINRSGSKVCSIDIPSGLMCEENMDNSHDNIVRADATFTLQFPKLSFLFAENEKYVGELEVLDISLSPEGIKQARTVYNTTRLEDVQAMFAPRCKFAHKGNFGRALLVAGSYGMAGASVLAAKAALRSGVGTLTVCLPRCNNVVMQCSVPEAMTLPDSCETNISAAVDTKRFSAVAIGPGLGRHSATEKALLQYIADASSPMVLDADALNILSGSTCNLDRLPEGCVITPHPAEFDRLVGHCCSSYERLQKARAFAQKYNLVVVLKGAYTAVVSPTGDCYFNTTGNPGMATAGSGDVLTGVVLALLARGTDSLNAARIAVYVHGLAGDISARKTGHTALVAGDIVEALPDAWKIIECM
ncbi:MAG: NAD(P)H-hydrate dehydratase [Bacteroidaceae bacterium]|nr:NAD(P)H-hydrate dehydratase [Bacteroidaceae bacterium]